MSMYTLESITKIEKKENDFQRGINQKWQEFLAKKVYVKYSKKLV